MRSPREQAPRAVVKICPGVMVDSPESSATRSAVEAPVQTMANVLGISPRRLVAKNAPKETVVRLRP